MNTALPLLELLGPNVSAEFRAALPQQYRANCGRRRVFFSAGDADAYDRGYSDHPVLAADAPEFGPYCDGYFDREQEVMDAFDYEFDEVTR